MKGSMTIVAAAMMLGVTVASAFAQEKAPIYRYCLLEAGNFRSGGGAMLCRFNTYAQCAQSKNSFADSCIINPELTFRRR